MTNPDLNRVSEVIAGTHALLEAGQPAEALKLLEAASATLTDVGERAMVLGYIGRIRADLGDLDTALELHQRSLKLFESLGREAERAVAIGEIARVRAAQGDVEGALDLHETELAIYDALGDRHSRVVTMVTVARLGALAGEPEEARVILTETLPVFEELEDLDGLGSALWALGKVELMLERHQDAFDHLSDSYKINVKLGRVDGICFVGVDLGQLLCAAGQEQEGRAVLERSRDGFVKLGQPELADKTQEVIDELFASAG